MILRILCLHGSFQNASSFQSDLKKLQERVWKNHEIELVFADSPISCEKTGYDTDCQCGKGRAARKENDAIGRIWFHEPSNSNIISDYAGMDASILHITQIWNRELYNRPFHGVMGYDQGAALSDYMSQGDMLPGCQFLILVGGYSLSAPLKHDDKKTLHFLPRDPCPVHDSRALFSQYSNAQSFHVSNCHPFPATPRVFNIIGKFLLSCKKDIISSHKGDTSLIESDRLRLSLLMNRASDALWKEVKNNPPRSLMAVITSNSLGAWNGARKDMGVMDKGGAPCPHKFLLKSQEREECDNDGNIENLT